MIGDPLSSSRPTAGLAERPISVLVVDDSEMCLELARIILEGIGVAVTTASSGAQAVALASEHDYDLIYMDVRMPDIDGLNASRMIRTEGARNSSIPIVGLSASTTTSQVVACLKAGMTTCFEKPYRPTALVMNLQTWVGRES